MDRFLRFFITGMLAPARRPYFYHSLAVESITDLFGFGYFYSKLNVITGDFSFLGRPGRRG